MVALGRTGLFIAALLFLTGIDAFGQISEESSLFQSAQLSFSAQKWTTAAAQFATFVQTYPKSAQAPTADFLRGVCYYQASQPALALDAFQKFSRLYPESPYLARLAYWKGVSAFALKRYDVAEKELKTQAQFPKEKPFYPRSLFSLALVYQEQGLNDRAEEALTEFASLSEEAELKAKAWLQIGLFRVQKKAIPQAIDAFEKVGSVFPRSSVDSQARIELLSVLTGQKQWAKAWALSLETASIFPARALEALAFQVEIARAQGNVAGQKLALETIAKTAKDPAAVQKAWTDLALLAEENQKPDVQLWKAAIEGPSEDLSWSALQRTTELLRQSTDTASALSALQKWIQARPSSTHKAQALILASKTAEGMQKLSLAATLANQAFDVDSKSPFAAEALFQRGIVTLKSGDLEKSLADFVRVVKDFPQAPISAEARYQIGMVYLKRSEPLRAEGYFFGLLNDVKSGDLYERALLARAMCFSNAGQLDLARSSLQRFLRESPGSVWAADAFFALGRTELLRRDFASAAAAFSQASQIFTSVSDQSKALWSSAEAYVSLQDWASAAKTFDSFAERFPSDDRRDLARYREGWCWTQSGDWKNALEVWKRDSDSSHNSALLFQARAEAYLRLGDAETGWKNLESISKGDDQAPQAWFSWALAASSLGQSSWANRAWETLIERYPDSKYVEQALPRAAGALLKSGDRDKAFESYARYFRKYGNKTTSAAVARSVCASTLSTDPAMLQKLAAAAPTWNLAPEVGCEFSLALWKSRIDTEPEAALSALKELSAKAPWSTQRSEAFLIVGLWATRQGKFDDAQSYIEAASKLGDDVSIFRARSAWASLAEKQGRLVEAAGLFEAVERTAGPGVPNEFRIDALRSAQRLWKSLQKNEETLRLEKRIAEKYPESGTPQ